MNDRSDSSSTVLVGETIISQLQQRGFTASDFTENATHVLLRRDHLEIVVPGPQRVVPESVVRMIEQSLESALGPHWLTAEPVAGARATSADDVLVLDVVILDPTEDELWRAFLLDDLSTIGYADTRRGALADLKAAAAKRTGVAPELLVLVTPDVI